MQENLLVRMHTTMINKTTLKMDFIPMCNTTMTYDDNKVVEKYFQQRTILEEILQNLVPPLHVLLKDMSKR